MNDVVKGKVVQTELLEREYEIFQKVVEKRGLTIKGGLREAVQLWVSAQMPVGEDPLFKVEPMKTGVKTNSSKLDRLLYEGTVE